MGLQFLLYDKDYTTSLENLTERQSGATLITSLPGGFGECELDIAMSYEEAWRWYYGTDGAGRFNCYLKVYDMREVIWEGRVSQIGLKPRGLHIVAEGYWRALYDIPYNNIVPAEDATRRLAHYDGTASLITDILGSGSCPQISVNYEHITANALLGPRYLEDYEWPGDLFVEFCRWGDVNFYPYEVAVWEDRELWYGPRGYVPWGEDAGAPPTLTERQPDWIVSLADLGIGDEDVFLNRALEDMWNSAFAEYEAANHEYGLTTIYNDTDSQARYGLTRRTALSLGWTLPTLADDARRRLVEEAKDAPQKAEFSIVGKVYDANGVAWDPWWVRAGHVIRIRDLVPAETMLQSPVLDQLRTFVIQETSCDVEAMSLGITPFYSPDRFSTIMALIELLGTIGGD